MAAGLSLIELEALREMADVSYFAARRCGFWCDAQQADLFRREGKRVVLNCSRQVGKSTIAALKAVHCAYWRPGATVVVTAPVKQQTREFLRKARGFARTAGLEAAGRGSRYCVEFENGSRVVGVAADEDTIRGFSAVAMVAVDEAARVADSVFHAVEPMLAVSGGALWIMSTPKGKRGYFYKAWMDAGWVKLSVRAADCARIPAAFLEDQRARLGERQYAQEFDCRFVEANDGVFDADAVARAFRKNVRPLDELEI